MSTNTKTAQGDSFVGQHRERLFFLFIVVGMLIFALGIAFSVLFIAMDTTPPAPYFATATDKYLTGGLSLVLLVIGAATVRLGAKFGGW